MKSKQALLGICILMLIPVITRAQKERIGESELAAISTAIERVRSAHGVPAVSAIVLYGDEVHSLNFGQMNRDVKGDVNEKSIYQIASLSKTFVGIVAHELIRAGTLDKDRSITQYLSDDLPEATKKRLEPITVEHLLHHRSGLPRTSPQRIKDRTGAVSIEYSKESLASDLNQVELLFSPGLKAEYSNFGYALLAHVCERASGNDYAELLKQYVTGPHSLNNTGMSISDAQQASLVTPYNNDDREVETAPWKMGLLAPPSAAYSTTEDLARLMKRQMKDYQAYQSGKKVSPLVLTTNTKELWKGNGISYGYGFMDLGNGTFGHGGGMSGYGSEYVFNPKRNFGFVLLTSSCGPWSTRLSDGVMKILGDQSGAGVDELVAVEQIVAAFRAGGQEAAFQVYQKLRTKSPSPLGPDARITLVNLALQFGLDDAANLFLNEAVSDFPDSAELKKMNEKIGGN